MELIDELNIRHRSDPYKKSDLAFPTAILVDRYGIVRWIYEIPYGNVRMKPNDLFGAIERMSLEEQNRELLRSRAVSRVVRQVFLMEESSDLGQVIAVMKEELQSLGFVFTLCAIGVFDEETQLLETYQEALPGDGGEEETTTSTAPDLATLPVYRELVSAWSEDRVFYCNLDTGSRWGVRCLVSVPFSHGTIVLGGSDPDQFSEDDVRTLTELAEAISVGYKRFLDFQELDKRHRELQQTQLQLIQSEKMASLGQLVAGLTHELNTPMGAIHSNVQSAASTLEQMRGVVGDAAPPNEQGHHRIMPLLNGLEELNRVNRTASDRIIRIVESLRSFARLDEAEWKRADLNRSIEDTLTLMRHEFGNRIQLVTSFDELPEIFCYPRQLNQALMSLFLNAVQAVDGEGEIRIETRRANESVVISVSDTGRGIPKDQLARIFDPGFTTKGVGVGAGLGLSICYRIVQNHNGDIHVRSQVGEGTTVIVEIPLHAAAPKRPAERRA